MNYYNDNDPIVCEWIRELIEEGLVPDGKVDCRSIEEVTPEDLRGFRQCHFFAGILGWPYALQLAGIPDDYELWTGSCPCQPFSVAGKQRGRDDKRNLWPEFYRLIRECKPQLVFGEQVSSVLGREWLLGKDTEVSQMRDRDAVCRVLRKLQRESGQYMHELRQLEREDLQAQEPGEETDRVQKLAEEQSRKGPLYDSQIQGEYKGPALFAGRNRYSGSDRCGQMRTDRHPVLLGRTEGLEFPFIGSDRFRCWLYGGEHEGCPLLRQRNGECLGTSQDIGNCLCYPAGAQRSEREPSDFSDGGVDEKNRHERIPGVRDDLEVLGYTFACARTSAASVGAPHIRQRLYWMAVSSAIGRGGGSDGNSSGHSGQVQTEGRIALGDGRMGDTDNARSQGRDGALLRECTRQWAVGEGSTWHLCKDGKHRRIPKGHQTQSSILGMVDGLSGGVGPRGEESLFPLAEAQEARVMMLRGYGNAIVPQLAALFIETAFEAIAETMSK